MQLQKVRAAKQWPPKIDSYKGVGMLVQKQTGL